jgi:cell shape-determining protein MreD
MKKPFLSYFLAILLFFFFVLLELNFISGFSSLFFINFLLIFIIILNFIYPFAFIAILALISSLIFDTLSFNLWGLHFVLFFLIIIFQRFLFNFFEKNTYYSNLFIGEILITFYFLSLALALFLFKQPVFYFKLLFSFMINTLIYWILNYLRFRFAI